MQRIFVNRAGLAVAAVLAVWHAAWAALVAFAAAQPLVDFIYRIHFVEASAPRVGPFDPAAAVMLVGTAAVAGYLMGAGLAGVWNCLAGWSSAVSEGRRGSPARAGF